LIPYILLSLIAIGQSQTYPIVGSWLVTTKSRSECLPLNITFSRILTSNILVARYYFPANASLSPRCQEKGVQNSSNWGVRITVIDNTSYLDSVLGYGFVYENSSTVIGHSEISFILTNIGKTTDSEMTADTRPRAAATTTTNAKANITANAISAINSTAEDATVKRCCNRRRCHSRRRRHNS